MPTVKGLEYFLMFVIITQLYFYKNNFNYVYSEKEPKSISLASEVPI
jgi:hypothetical protein